jgi:hypothetical protein
LLSQAGTAPSSKTTCNDLRYTDESVVLLAGLCRKDRQSTFAVHCQPPAALAVIFQSKSLWLLLLMMILLFTLQLALQLFKGIQRGSHPLLLGRLLGGCYLLGRALQRQPARHPA